MSKTPTNPSGHDSDYAREGYFPSYVLVLLVEKRIVSGDVSGGIEEPSDNFIRIQTGPIVPTRVAEDVFVLFYISFASVRQDAPRF